MKLKDKNGIVYQMVKKDGNYYLITSYFNRISQKQKVRIEVKGKENIFKYIKNNQLERVEE